MKQYKVIRSYDDGPGYVRLQTAFNEGYAFVRASEYVPEAFLFGETRRAGYIEYILAKEESEAHE